MKRMRTFIVLVLLFFPVLAGGGQGDNNPVFTDEDLERYTRPSEGGKSTEERNPSEESLSSRVPPTAESIREGKAARFEIMYTAYEGMARRVIIPVTLNGSVTVPMALDTGSPGMIITEGLAQRLGLFDSGDGTLLITAAGIGGSVPAVLTVIDTVQVAGAEDHFVPTIVTHSLSPAFEGLIGMDFMSNYAIKIDTRRHVVVFEELPHTRGLPAGHDALWWKANFHRFVSIRAQWKEFREKLNRQTGDPRQIQELKDFADRQYRAADKLFGKLNSYAIENSVPMTWREY